MADLAPDTKLFYALWLPFQDARRTIESLAFLRRLRDDPGSIVWDNPWVWMNGIQSSQEEKRLAAEDLAFADAYRDYTAKRSRLLSHKLLPIRNAAYARHKNRFQPLEAELQAQLNALQREVNKHKRA